MADININREFADFGKCCYYMAICMILNLVPYLNYVVGFIGLYFFIKSLKVIKRINSQLNNENLAVWRSKMILALVIIVVGIILGIVLMILFVGILATVGEAPDIAAQGIVIVFLIFMLVLVAISGYLQMKAWENLNTFFEENRSMFPEIVVVDSLNGTKKLRTGALLQALIITAIIGFIFSIIGLFKLSTLRNLEAVSAEMPMARPAPAPEAAAVTPGPPEMAEAIEFCGNCGTKLEPSWSVCPECGSPVGGEVTYQPTIEQPYEPKKGKTYGSLGLAFGLISLCCCCGPVFGPLSILFGVLGLFKDDDRSLAIIGLVLGIIGTICGLLFWLVVWPALTAPPPEE